MKSENTVNDEFFDCAGNKRVFRLATAATPGFFEGVELRRGEPVGLRFLLPIESGKAPPWGEMREKIRKRLSSRDLVRDEDGELHNLNNIIRAQIHDRTGDGMPTLVIDDEEIDWDELGAIIKIHSGWGLRIEICNIGDE